ncbi:hypothetical protein vBVnaSL3_19 [Vibrio phage vB_VnaS-L3]|nr:hypothetical protein vBVnaSL3_19 [Vibrio phage vB_VnaS-L3]
MPNLIKSKYPPVNGNICEKFVAINSQLEPVQFEWADELNAFMLKGTSIDVSYSELERDYEVFIWESQL